MTRNAGLVALVAIVATLACASAAHAGNVYPSGGALGKKVNGVTVECSGQDYACAGGGYQGSEPWGFYTSYGSRDSAGRRHNCTTYAAFRLAQNGLPNPRRSWGNANDWDANAGGANGTPAVGSIAQWEMTHVAYVESVDAGGIVITDDNYGANRVRRVRIDRGSPAWPDNFLHLRDVAASSGGGGSPANTWIGMGAYAFKGSDRLEEGEELRAGQYILAPDVRTVVAMQPDGNLVVYGPGGQPLWSSGTAGSGASRTVMQSDGNLVVYAGDRAVWQSGTAGHGPSFARVQDDGNFVVYRKSGGHTWATYKTIGAGPIHSGTRHHMPGATLRPNHFIRSFDRRYALVMQGDGNLVLYGPGYRALWSSGTPGGRGVRAVMQSDGNLVSYGANNAPLWQSGTGGQGRATLILQDDGNLVIYRESDHRVLWHTQTGGKV